MKLLQTTIAAAALFLSACSTEDSLGGDWDGRLHLSSNVATLTRATHDLDTKIAADQTVWLYIEKSNDTHVYGKQLTTVGSNGFSGADDMFFPAEEATSINIYAFHINEKSSSISTAAYPSSKLTHQVGKDQKSTNTGDGSYAKSDLLYAKTTLSKTDAKTNSGAITLPFKHSLSKIEVILKKNAEVIATVTKLEILNTKLEATFTPGRTDELTVTASGSPTAIEIDHDVTGADGDKLNEAIIIPQKLNDKTEFIRVTLDSGATLVYQLGEQTEFKKGTKYTYTITSKLTGLEVTSTIDDWGNGAPASGYATM